MVGNRLRVFKDPESETAIIRVQRSVAKMLSQMLPFIKEHRKRSILLQTLHVTGTLRACQKFRLKYERRCLLSLLKSSQSEAERKVIQESLMRCATTPEEDSDIEVDE
ncbi:Ribonuclease P/MRP protein subunit POP5 [Holothuria leucospilota]|uniref:Ribonuclease P/MRP protein subunit POP5 n=1 Tax=Holothuria leucospilota TaxID=206669 RepID=A0A9Q1HF29_HOLLE|nr:Ribonuclease P/MRP protein subunit POP5 [Holothuria leucospilota]